MMSAAAIGATAFQKGLGAIHALSHPVGALYDTHHGLTNAVFMPYVLAFNRKAVKEKVERLAGFIGLRPRFSAFLDWTLELREELGVPHTLGRPQGRRPEVRADVEDGAEGPDRRRQSVKLTRAARHEALSPRAGGDDLTVAIEERIRRLGCWSGPSSCRAPRGGAEQRVCIRALCGTRRFFVRSCSAVVAPSYRPDGRGRRDEGRIGPRDRPAAASCREWRHRPRATSKAGRPARPSLRRGRVQRQPSRPWNAAGTRCRRSMTARPSTARRKPCSATIAGSSRPAGTAGADAAQSLAAVADERNGGPRGAAPWLRARRRPRRQSHRRRGTGSGSSIGSMPEPGCRSSTGRAPASNGLLDPARGGARHRSVEGSGESGPRPRDLAGRAVGCGPARPLLGLCAARVRHGGIDDSYIVDQRGEGRRALSILAVDTQQSLRIFRCDELYYVV